MEIGLYMYNTSPLFEIIVAKYILETKHNVIIMRISLKQQRILRWGHCQ